MGNNNTTNKTNNSHNNNNNNNNNNSHLTSSSSLDNPSSNSNSNSNSKEDLDYPQLGSVTVNLSWLATTNRSQQQTEVIVTGKGALFHGSQLPSNDIITALKAVKLSPITIPLLDSKAHHFLITYSNGWNALSSPEIFSRHSGTCIIIGDRTNVGKPYPIKVGDCFRLGSVGVVVSEIKNDRGIEQKLDTNRLQYLREEALAFEGDDEAALAAEEEDHEKRKVEKTSHEGGENNAQFFCYMCYETHDTPEDHLVAPCDCKGDTRYLHVQCLQKWYQSSVCGSKALVIRTTGNGAPACKICGAAYKTVFRNNGVKTNLLEMDHPGPYISLVVVTRHDTSPGLFNTKFRLNFGPGYRAGFQNQLQDDPDLSPVELSIGRSSLCNMVLDYRTVSTVHAKLSYRNGQFFVQDSRSSNGTMVYLQGPLPLPNNETIRLRMGRSTLAIKAKRTFSASVRCALHRLPNNTPCTASLERLQEIMALAPAPIPRSIRLGADSELHNVNNNNNKVGIDNNNNGNHNGANDINLNNNNLNSNNLNNNNNNHSQQQQQQQTQFKSEMYASSPFEDNFINQNLLVNRNEEIDQALILGPERRDGGSGHEKLDSPVHSQNSWHQTLSPNPLTKPLSQRSSSISPPPQLIQQSLSQQNLVLENSNHNETNKNLLSSSNIQNIEVLKPESPLPYIHKTHENSNEDANSLHISKLNNKNDNNNNTSNHDGNQRETIHISKINLSSYDESDNVSFVSGGGDSVSMVAVNSSINPLSAIAITPKITQMLTPEDDENVSTSDVQSNQAVASVQNISRALVSDIMSNTLKS